MTGRSQEELVAMLRSTKQGETVSVVVARQDDILLPREMVTECEHTKKAAPMSSASLLCPLLFDCQFPLCSFFFTFPAHCVTFSYFSL